MGALDIPVSDWNIYGGCVDDNPFFGNCGGPAPIDTLVFFTAQANPRPWVITLNEVCSLQAMDLASRLGAYGYSLHYTRTNGTAGLPAPDARYSRVSCGLGHTPAGGIHGNAIVYLGTPMASGAVDFTKQDPGGDYRSVGWVQTNTFIGPIRALATHLDYSSNNDGATHTPSSTNGLQNTQLLNLFTLHALTGQPVILGSDRNTTRHEPFAGIAEVDTASPKKRTHVNYAPTRKLDWIFGSGRFATRAGASTYCPPYASHPTSDHCLLSGKFAI